MHAFNDAFSAASAPQPYPPADQRERPMALGSLLDGALDLRTMFGTQPAPMDQVLRGLAPGMIGVVLGTGGVGKSFLMLYVCAAVATVASGRDVLGCLLPTSDHKTGRVVYLAGEDGPEVMHHRLYRFGSHLHHAAYEAMVENVKIVPLVGKAPVLIGRDGLVNDKAIEMIRSVARGSRLVVIDPLRQFHSADECDNGIMSDLFKALVRVADEEQCAIILVHHTSKAAAREGAADDASASRGASAITDNARWVMTVRKLTPKEFQRENLIGERWQYVSVWNPKINHAENGSPVILKRIEGGLLAPLGIDDRRVDEVEEPTSIATAQPRTRGWKR